jgi:hypothetical protein
VLADRVTTGPCLAGGARRSDRHRRYPSRAGRSEDLLRPRAGPSHPCDERRPTRGRDRGAPKAPLGARRLTSRRSELLLKGLLGQTASGGTGPRLQPSNGVWLGITRWSSVPPSGQPPPGSQTVDDSVGPPPLSGTANSSESRAAMVAFQPASCRRKDVSPRRPGPLGDAWCALAAGKVDARAPLTRAGPRR